MSEILVSARLGRSLFDGLSPWVGRLPGGLVHVNVAGSTLFAAVSGSSAATTAIVGRVTLPELQARGYDRSLAMGSLAGAGTLGFLIPPSIIMIIYGVVAEQSILELFVAGVIPGLALALLYSLYIAGHQLVTRSQPPSERPDWRASKRAAEDRTDPGADRRYHGSLYLGLASPTELAAVGVLGAAIFAALSGNLKPRQSDRGRAAPRCGPAP